MSPPLEQKSPARQTVRKLRQRALLLCIWAAMLLVFFWIGQVFVAANIPNNLEQVLLDVRLRFRAEHMAPSDQIVLLALDRRTEEGIRRYPELGINSLTLPRERVAQLVQYLKQAGAKAVILDVELRDGKAGDPVLAAAMAEAGNVYAAVPMDTNLDSFIEQQSELRSPEELAYDILYKIYLQPYLLNTPAFHAYHLKKPVTSLIDLGFEPFSPVYSIIHIPRSILARYLETINLSTLKASQWLPTSDMRLPVTLRDPPHRDALRALYFTPCVDSFYKKSYGQHNPYLDFLAQAQVIVHTPKSIPEAADRQITFCYTAPLAEPFRPALKSIGITSVQYDEDAFVRSIPILFRGYQGNFYLYLGARPVVDLLPDSKLIYFPEYLQLGGKTVHWHDGHQVFINWRNPALAAIQLKQSYPQWVPESEQQLQQRVRANRNNDLLAGGHLYRKISAIDLIRKLEGQATETLPTLHNIPGQPESGEYSFEDKIVIYGNTVTDIHRTPVGRTIYGPEIVANTVDMLLNDSQFIQKTPNTWTWTLAILVISGVLYATIEFTRLALGFTFSLMLIALYWIGNFVVFSFWGYWSPLVIPTFCFIVSLIGGTLYRYYVQDREKHQLTHVFSNYVSPQIMEQIVSNPDMALENLKGEKKELTVLFTDLQGFTSQFEDKDPAQMVSQLNEYFDVMIEIILNHGGTYDKFMGDAIMAFFGAPTDVPNHAERACEAALEMQLALRYLNSYWEREGFPPLKHGVGISSGEMFVGNFGSQKIKNFTVMGSNVNLGARLESFTRETNAPIIISARTHELAADRLNVRDLGEVRVKGFSKPVQVYALLGITKTSSLSSWSIRR